MKRSLALPLFAVLVLAACRGGSSANDKGGASARELKDPRTVPSATVPAQVPSPIPAVDVSRGQQAGTPAGRATATPAPNTYIVKAGDTPAGIAASLDVGVEELLRANGITDPGSLKIGQQLTIPKPSPTPAPRPGSATPTATATRIGSATPSVRAGAATATRPAGGTANATATATSTRTPSPPAAGSASTYTVQAGDTGCGIAQSLGVPISALAQANSTTADGLANLRIGQVLQVPTQRGPSGC